MSHYKPLRSTVTLGVAVLALVGYNFLSAWTTPPGNPPNLNVDTPINTGTATQNKDGALSVNTLGVFGVSSITSGAPSLRFDDTTVGERGYQIHNNLNSLYFRGDRNDDGSYTGEAPWPLQLFAATTSAGDYAMFSNRIRATEYCDRAGGNCFTSADVTDVTSDTGGVDFRAMGTNKVSGLTPGKVYLFFVSGAAADRSGASISSCGAPGTILAQTRFEAITGRNTQESHIIPFKVPSGVTCMLGYTRGSSREAAEYMIAMEASASSYVSSYYWDTGSWSSCNITDYNACSTSYGTQTRTVQCVNGLTGVNVAASYCPTPKPSVSQSCSVQSGGGQC